MTWWAISAFAFIYLTGGLTFHVGMSSSRTLVDSWVALIAAVCLWPVMFWAAVALTISDKIAERLEREVGE